MFEAGGPGYECMVGDEKFTALLGTMHGRSVVDLIVTHATGLPSSTIESATIFTIPSVIVDVGEAFHMIRTLSNRGADPSLVTNDSKQCER